MNKLFYLAMVFFVFAMCKKEEENLPPISNFYVSSTTIGEGESIQFFDTSINSPTSWLWKFGDGSTSIDQNPMHVFGSAGNFEVSLEVKNNYGSSVKTINITVLKIVTDIDGNKYHIVTIGTQVWMAENLKTTRYRNSDLIPNVSDKLEWEALNTGAFCIYNNDEINSNIYGHLYNWFAVADSRNIAPIGWHVPSDAEWATLVDFLGGQSVAGGKLKELGANHWRNGNLKATNEFGFTALPGGYRNFDGKFSSIGFSGTFWSTTIDILYPWYCGMNFDINDIYRGHDFKKEVGFSIRCVKD